MKGDIAVAGLVITAEEWQALDAGTRAQLVAVITRQEPVLAAGSGPIATAPARLADGTNPGIVLDTDVPEAPEAVDELPSSAVQLIDADAPVGDPV